MSKRTATANGSDPCQNQAARNAVAVQYGCNLVAIVGAFHRNLLLMHLNSGGGDDLINHPVSLAFVSKLYSLCRLTPDREVAALQAIDLLEHGQNVDYEVISL